MNLPNLPSEKIFRDWLNDLWRHTIFNFGVVLKSIHSPASLILQLKDARLTSEQAAPFSFTLMVLVFASLLGIVADIVFGVDTPFFEGHSYQVQWQTYGHLLTSLQKILPFGFSATIVIHSFKFFIVLLVIVYWARLFSGKARNYWADVSLLLYLLPIVLVAEIIEYCSINLAFRILGDQLMIFNILSFIFRILSILIVYGVILRVIDKVYFVSGWPRLFHVTGYLVIFPALVLFLNVLVSIVPVGYYAYRVINPTIEGDSMLELGNYEVAEKLYSQAIQNDLTGLWSSHAHIRLVSVSAHQILSLLPDISGDTGIRDQLLRKFSQKDPFRRVSNSWQSKETISITPVQLTELRDSILDYYINSRGIPVTNSELDCALRTTAASEGCDYLPAESVKLETISPTQRQELFFLIFRTKALSSEPTKEDSNRYLKFLFELPIRIETMFVRYHALNLARDSKTLAYLEGQDRMSILNRDWIIKRNKEVLKRGYKFPSLLISDDEIRKLSVKELGFHMRQLYLNYLRTESRLLKATPFSMESSFIQQQVSSMEENLNWVANEKIYKAIPRGNFIEEEFADLNNQEIEPQENRHILGNEVR